MSKNLGKGVILMNIKTLLFAILLGFSLTAAAEFRTVSLAHEVALSNFRVPPSLNAGVSFKTCDDCEMQTVRSTPLTQYIVNGQQVTLKEFRKSVFKVRDRSNSTVIVLQHLETNTIVSVSVTI
jgi:hypothetical protein